MPWEIVDAKGVFVCQVGDADVGAVSNRETAETMVGFGVGKETPKVHPRDHEMKVSQEPLHKTLLRAEQDFKDEGGKPDRIGFVKLPDNVKPDNEYDLRHVGTGLRIRIRVGKKRSKNPLLLGRIVSKNVP